MIVSLLKILWTILRFRIDQLWLPRPLCLSWWLGWLLPRCPDERGERLYQGCITMGPFFVKWGQFMAMRHDFLPNDITHHLARLQDRLPPFSGKQAQAMLTACYQQPLTAIFESFDLEPVASASIAQVHRATLLDGTAVAVKLLRPGIQRTVAANLRLLRLVARCLAISPRLRRQLRPQALVAQYTSIIEREINLRAEAANAAQLMRMNQGRSALLIPQVHWPYVRENVVVYDWMEGKRVDDETTRNLPWATKQYLAEKGVELFIQQVFDDRFFHADLHAGNLWIDTHASENPDVPSRFIALDFGIVGTLSTEDCQYLAANFLAFFKKDYGQIARLHVQAGWVPQDADVSSFEHELRTVCEPLMSKSLKDMSMGQLFVELLRVAQNHQMRLQPQLVLLQKTLLNVESIAQQLYPELDLWSTAKPTLERWFKSQNSMSAWRQRWQEQGGAMQLHAWLALPQLWHDWLEAKKHKKTEPSRKITPVHLYVCTGLIGISTGVIGMVVGMMWGA